MASGRVSKVKGKVVDIPNAPTIGTATAGAESATVAFTAYSGSVGGPTFSYRAVSNPGSVVGTGTTSPITVSGLTAGTAYTFTVAGVNPTGTGEYSSASGSITPTVATSYESIATVTVGSGGSSSIDFTSIPSTYTHLQVRGITLGSAAPSGSMLYQFNSDTSSNYNSHLLGSNGSVATSYFAGGGSETSGRFYGYYDNLANNNYPLVFVMDILDYANTNKYKTVKTLSGMDKNGNNYGEIFLYSSLWRSTTAVSTLKLFCGGQNLGQYTQFALYGIKGA